MAQNYNVFFIQANLRTQQPGQEVLIRILMPFLETSILHERREDRRPPKPQTLWFPTIGNNMKDTLICGAGVMPASLNMSSEMMYSNRSMTDVLVLLR
jgi:hypothetical protein